MFLAVPLLLVGGAGAAYVFVPSVHKSAQAMLASPPPPPEAEHPNFVSLPEMTVTLPNGGHPHQLRISIALELAKAKEESAAPSAEATSPRVYDALITYLRTLHDADIDGSLAIDRLRGDLYRRLDLLLGQGVVRDVLITNLVVA